MDNSAGSSNYMENILSSFAFTKSSKKLPSATQIQSQNLFSKPSQSQKHSIPKQSDPSIETLAVKKVKITQNTRQVKKSTKKEQLPKLSFAKNKKADKDNRNLSSKADHHQPIEEKYPDYENQTAFRHEMSSPEKQNKKEVFQGVEKQRKFKVITATGSLPNSQKLGYNYDPDDYKASEECLCLPDWAKEPKMRDKNGRAPEDPNYDPTTLYIPPMALDKLSVTQRRYWEVKSQHFDKLIFLKMHREYLVYHKDALICHLVCGSRLFCHINYTHVSVYIPTINKYCQKLIDKNYKVVFVEPIEPYQDTNDAKLEVYEILTKGTFIESNISNFTSRYCLLLTQKDDNWGFTYLDTTTHEFFMGEFNDTPSNTHLRSLLLRITPVEIVYRDRSLSKRAVLMMKNLYWKPALTALSTTLPRGIESVIYRIRAYLRSAHEQPPTENRQEIQLENAQPSRILPNLQVLNNLVAMAEEYMNDARQYHDQSDNHPDDTHCPHYWTLQGVYLALEYLEYLYLADTVFSKCSFYIHDLRKDKSHSMMLDGQTVYNLELLDIPYINNDIGGMSLLKYMDKTRSGFGKRMFRRWLLEPLRDVERINERLDAVEDLMANDELCEMIQNKLSKLGDLERTLHGIYNHKTRTVLDTMDYDTYVKSKMIIFGEALRQVREADDAIKFLSEFLLKVKSKRVCQLLSYFDNQTSITGHHKKIEGMFPQVEKILAKMEALIVIRNNIPMPAPGRDSAYDKLIEEAEKIKAEFQIQLENTRKMFKCEAITYVHTRYRYELEIPEYILQDDKKPKNFLLTSKKKGYLRFQTPQIQDLLEALKLIEWKMQKVVLLYFAMCYKEFYKHHVLWQQMIVCLSELDCLVSLALLAKSMPSASRPTLISLDEDNHQRQPVFELRCMLHPCITALRPAELFVTNDVVLEPRQAVFLITGPNMGGKSTLMRTVCISTIMAQIGSFVPARSFSLTPRDRIFTRIGATDNIFEGKSTFFVELEETMTILSQATSQSLVIMDELGRGTSTYDGMAIAYAVLRYLAESVGCMTLFATHFHLLLEEFRMYEKVEMYFMDSEFIEDELMRFLYKFRKGWIGNSFGLSVAKLAGLPKETVEKAREKAQLMNREQVNLQGYKGASTQFNETIRKLAKVENEDFDESVLLEDLVTLFH